MAGGPAPGRPQESPPPDLSCRDGDRDPAGLAVTFRDTANVCRQGTWEEITGRLPRKYTRREEIALATKVCRDCDRSSRTG